MIRYELPCPTCTASLPFLGFSHVVLQVTYISYKVSMSHQVQMVFASAIATQICTFFICYALSGCSLRRTFPNGSVHREHEDVTNDVKSSASLSATLSAEKIHLCLGFGRASTIHSIATYLEQQGVAVHLRYFVIARSFHLVQSLEVVSARLGVARVASGLCLRDKDVRTYNQP